MNYWWISHKSHRRLVLMKLFELWKRVNSIKNLPLKLILNLVHSVFFFPLQILVYTLIETIVYFSIRFLLWFLWLVFDSNWCYFLVFMSHWIVCFNYIHMLICWIFKFIKLLLLMQIFWVQGLVSFLVWFS